MAGVELSELGGSSQFEGELGRHRQRASQKAGLAAGLIQAFAKKAQRESAKAAIRGERAGIEKLVEMNPIRGGGAESELKAAIEKGRSEPGMGAAGLAPKRQGALAGGVGGKSVAHGSIVARKKPRKQSPPQAEPMPMGGERGDSSVW